MPKTESSNVEKLRDAGIISKLSPDQVAAIESLSLKQVDQLIAVNKTLDQAVSGYAPMIVMPGRIATKPAKAAKATKRGKPAKP